MRLRTVSLLVLGGILPSMGGCGDLLGTGNGGPTALASSSPVRGTSGVSVLTDVTLRFVQPMDTATVRDGVRLLDGSRIMRAHVSALDPEVFLISPRDPLDFGTRYTVVIPESVRTSDGEPLEREESWHFKTEGKAPPDLSIDRMTRHLRTLAHDSMRGRGSGSADERKAALYIASSFETYGLVSPPTGFVQDFSVLSPRSGEPVVSQNVVGLVRGSGALSDEWVVVGAHYDHIGFRNLSNESQGPNNGADDNASGTAVVLELARRYRSWTASGGTGKTSRRSVMFIAFGAEEEGLLGSCYFTDVDPLAPLAATRTMMNLDMVGRLRNDYLRIAVNEGTGLWTDLAGDSNAPLLDLDVVPTTVLRGTDHVCFGRRGIPFASFHTGTHPEYHTPADDVDLLDIRGMRSVGEVALRILGRLVVMPEPPTFQSF